MEASNAVRASWDFNDLAWGTSALPHDDEKSTNDPNDTTNDELHSTLDDQVTRGHDDTEDLVFLLVVLNWLVMVVENQLSRLERLLADHLREQARLNWALPAEKQRPTWSEFCNRIGPTHFRRMFRMPVDVFDLLCIRIRAVIGEGKFRSEDCLASKEVRKNCKQFKASLCFGGFAPGEARLAIAVRMLAGGSHSDLVPLFVVATTQVCVCLNDFLEWVLLTFHFPLPEILCQHDWSKLQQFAVEFAEKSSGLFHGGFASLDGLAIRVQSPSLKEVSDPGNF